MNAWGQAPVAGRVHVLGDGTNSRFRDSRASALSRSAAAYRYIPAAVPLIVFDGVVSCLRSYTVAELAELTRGLDHDGYRFQIGSVKSRGQRLTYVLGTPAAPPDWALATS